MITQNSILSLLNVTGNGVIASQGVLRSSALIPFIPFDGAVVDLDFENNVYFFEGQQYNNFLDIPNASVIRSNGTVFDSNGNIVEAGGNTPRLTHNPVTLESEGILSEQGSTNLLAFGNPSEFEWVNNGSLQDELDLNALGLFKGVNVRSQGRTFHRVNHPNVPVTPQTYFVTFFYRQGSSATVRFNFRDPTTSRQTLAIGDWDDPQVAAQGIGSLNIVSNEQLADGLTRRIVFEFDCNYTGNLQLGFGPNSNIVNDSIILLGAQLETGDYASSFIPTTGTQITRSNERIFIDGLAFPFQSLGGTIYADAITQVLGSTSPYMVQLDNGNTSFRYLLRYSAGVHMRGFVIDNANTSYTTSAGTALTSPAFSKSALSFDNTSLIAASLGETNENTTGGTIPTNTTILRVGSNLTGNTSHTDGSIKRLALIDEKYNELRLLALTSGVSAKPVTDDLSLTVKWDDPAVAYTALSNTSEYSASMVADLSTSGDGVLMESGGTGLGVILYTYQGVLYYQAGDGMGFGSNNGNRVEISWPIVDGRYMIECVADRLTGLKLYIDGKIVAEEDFVTPPAFLADSDAGGYANIRSAAAVNRGGWTSTGDGTYPEYISFINIYEGQTP